MNTPNQEFEFSGIIQKSYTVGELSDLIKEAQKMDLKEDNKKRPFRRFGRHSGPGLFGDPLDS
jgi:hypothetical protein